jgi:hypothetical protein
MLPRLVKIRTWGISLSHLSLSRYSSGKRLLATQIFGSFQIDQGIFYLRLLSQKLKLWENLFLEKVFRKFCKKVLTTLC